MARPKALKPAYCHHKPSNRAYVSCGGKIIYLGDYGTQESRDAYDRVMGEWIARGRISEISTAAEPSRGISISQLINAFWKHAQTYYRRPDGSQSPEVDNFRHALRPLRRLYGNKPACDFGPLALKTVRDAMMTPSSEIDAQGKRIDRPGLARLHLNRQIARIRQMFKWGGENELVPASVYHGLATVSGLRQGRSQARETEPIRPVPDGIVEATLPHMSPTVADMVNLQLITGMRPGEVCAMRGRDIDTTAALWVYKPSQHKTQHHGHERTVYMGKRQKELVTRHLKANIDAHLFSPAEAEAERKAKLRENDNRPRRLRPLNANPSRKPGDFYTVNAYRRAIARACDHAFTIPAELREPRTPKQRKAAQDAGLLTPEAVAKRAADRKAWRRDHTWHPHQLRHNAATRFRKEYGLEAAQVLLGHKTLTVTQVYAEKNVAAAQQIMLAVG